MPLRPVSARVRQWRRDRRGPVSQIEPSRWGQIKLTQLRERWAGSLPEIPCRDGGGAFHPLPAHERSSTDARGTDDRPVRACECCCRIFSVQLSGCRLPLLDISWRCLLGRRQHGEQTEQALCLTLVTNAVVLFNSVYLQKVLGALRQDGHDVGDQAAAHLSPALHQHINFYGSYSFDVERELNRTGLRPLRDPA